MNTKLKRLACRFTYSNFFNREREKSSITPPSLLDISTSNIFSKLIESNISKSKKRWQIQLRARQLKTRLKTSISSNISLTVLTFSFPQKKKAIFSPTTDNYLHFPDLPPSASIGHFESPTIVLEPSFRRRHKFVSLPPTPTYSHPTLDGWQRVPFPPSQRDR